MYNKDLTKLILAPELYEKSTITIPKTVKEIADNKSSLAIKNLKEIKVEPGNYWFSSLGGILYRNYFDKMVNKELRKIITIPSKIGPTLYIPNDVILDSHNFSFNDSIENIHLQEGIKIIPEFTFNNLKNLKLIEIPASVESFSSDAFVNIDHDKLKIKVANNISPFILDIIKKVNKNIEK
ncbi:leucine-rich repeat domain-containing protein [Mycoplasmopsis cynos]|uniref:leucine-rich repeat domain-containing protein n=1 Tax=Mycoplasmopsis cynos TaxID=171284 RepID=UPI0022034152|nr:leucine-rich repeat domain-containing protein [Mycoplasmopsis cynos]UWV86468.1 leucine-rich repeat domain-containing protein [Mycoplasmopsis cynos]